MKHAAQTQLSGQDYLASERASPIRHEYVAGEAFAMAGGSKAHNLISGRQSPSLIAEVLSAADRVDVACDGTRLTLDDLYEDTGLLVV